VATDARADAPLDDAHAARGDHRFWPILALVVLTVSAIYGQGVGHDFVEFDDPSYVRDNPQVRDGLTWEGVAWSFAPRLGIFHPLTLMSLMLGEELAGPDSAGVHKAMSALLHAANAAMLLVFLLRATGRLGPSALVALLFAVHPMQVEAVSWVSGRKDVLAGFFFLLMLLFYQRSSRRMSGRAMAAVALLFALGLLSKGAIVMVPFVLLLLDVWPLGSTEVSTQDVPGWRRLVLEKWPLFALSSVFIVIAIGTAGSLLNPWIDDPSLLRRIAEVPLHALFYLQKLLVPVGLTVAYPSPAQMGLEPWSALRLVVSGIALAALIAGALGLRQRAPAIVLGLLWLLVLLLPLLGIVPNALRMPQDRYVYLPSIGLFIALAFGSVQLAGAHGLGRRWRLAGQAAGAAAVIVCGGLAFVQVGHWKSSDRLFEHALAVSERNAVVHFSLAMHLVHTGRDDEALSELDRALVIHPLHFQALATKGFLLDRRGDAGGAIAQYRAALAIAPDYVPAMINLGDMLTRESQAEEAGDVLRRAIAIAPESVNAHYVLGLALDAEGRHHDAIRAYEAALRIEPEHRGVGAALARSRNLATAR